MKLIQLKWLQLQCRYIPRFGSQFGSSSFIWYPWIKLLHLIPLSSKSWELGSVAGFPYTTDKLAAHMYFTGRPSEFYRSQLGSFGVSGELALRPVASLSGGQKSRVAFAAMSMTTWVMPDWVSSLYHPLNHQTALNFQPKFLHTWWAN